MDNNAQAQAAPKKRNPIFIIILAVLIIGGAWFGISKYRYSLHHEDTDDAQISADISPVIPRVSGYVSEVRVNDNEYVHKGDTLVILDGRDLQIRLDDAEASLEVAKSNLANARAATSAARAGIAPTTAAVSTIDAQIESAKINAWRAGQDYERYNNLYKDHSITQQQYEQALAAKQTADQQLNILQEQKKQASGQSNAVAQQSNATAQQISVAEAHVKQSEVNVESAKLNLSYTVITAPENGLISKVNVQTGQLLQQGQSLFSIVHSDDKWVIANFKETQLNKMQVGQKVTVEADVFPKHEFEATVTSFSPATGSTFALLPPDNATGNFVKVVQRVPVKIEFDAQDSLVSRLRPGMNVTVDVHIN